MKIKDILNHFISRSSWVNPEHTVDRIIIGNPEETVSNCLVSWMANFKALHYMVEQNIKLLMCHEPVFWNHWDKIQDNDPIISEKKHFIEKNNLIILRNHSCWDRWPSIGIPWAWAQFLGFGDKPAVISTERYQHRYDIKPIPAQDLTIKLAKHCAEIGEPMLQLTGPASKLVSKIGVGTGCCCDIKEYIEIGCDCSIVCDDGSYYWATIQMAEDLDHPVIRVNHGTSEEAGMITLTKYINDNIEGLSAQHLPHGNTFALIG